MPIYTLADFRAERETALTLGTFDGLHLGHRALLERTVQRAREQRLQSVAFVFRRPPQNYVGAAKSLILPIEKKLRALENSVEVLLAVEFPEVGWMEAEAFVQKILAEQLRARTIVIGPDARFGKGRRGNAELLFRLGPQYDFVTEVIPRVTVQDETVSSTAIREHLMAGRVESAQALLGYLPKLFGRVVRGDGRGRKLGYPTANLQIDQEVLLPAAGVYAVRVFWRNFQRDGVLYIGSRATFADASPSIEVHLFDTEEDLYGVELEVALLKHLREDQRFDSLETLRVQIETDIRAVRSVLRA
ncbi:riboflavin biosynthesis protein RibF [Candidatus Acetothermia bacterium]|jgi:riboflavin kinase/FMN adenylyltransferase|nr:riboflavin biosynthesis protein RibF [Candidatus Acetothermia bacterium]MCI2432247.1 riboflavin biosynthesis protein RibF [Candidatus Acetothermia bacterium]MCI2436503.1 riboflavin biosynthesis protein RibF [Candidatus Acetothermia bacterium]